jgi:hypothetical protein
MRRTTQDPAPAIDQRAFGCEGLDDEAYSVSFHPSMHRLRLGFPEASLEPNAIEDNGAAQQIEVSGSEPLDVNVKDNLAAGAAKRSEEGDIGERPAQAVSRAARTTAISSDTWAPRTRPLALCASLK